ncbi:MAG: Ig-like domain-containing protein [Bacteroidetes bacterium]|nr:Ig-like domain-containing protein [Bacteroidota bacterium]
MKHWRALWFIAVLSGCATEGTLTGGAKDDIPPKPLEYSIADSTVNFTGKELKIEFNENISIRNSAIEFYVSPPLDPKPEIEAQGKMLKVKLLGLKENSTYVLHFGESLVDLNEGNPLSNFTYTLSTGNEIDTLQRYGTVKDYWTNEPLDQYLVAFYSNKGDSLVKNLNNIPNYISYTKKGQFKADALMDGNYLVAVFNDQNRDLKWQPQEEIAFEQNVVVNGKIDTLQLKASKQKPERIAYDYKAEPNGRLSFVFTQPVSSCSFNSNVDLETRLSHTRDSLIVCSKSKLSELVGVLVINDQTPDSLTIAIPEVESKKGPVQFLQLKVGGGIKNYKSYSFYTNEPIDAYANDAIKLFEDTILLTDYEVVKHGGLYNRLVVNYAFDSTKKYKLVVDSGALVGRTRITNNRTEWEMGKVEKQTLSISVSDSSKIISKGLIVHLLNEKNTLLQERTVEFSQGIMLKFKVSQGTYKFRIIADDNLNKVWDPVSIENETQAERILLTGEYKVIADWDSEAIQLILPNK